MQRTIGFIECNYSATESSPLTEVRPAASLPFHGRYRLIDFALSNMVNAGISVISLVLPNNYRSIIDHVGAGKEWGLARKRGGLFPAPGSAFGMAREGGRFLVRDIIANKAVFMRNNYDYVLFSTANFVMNIDFDEMLEAHKATGADITMLTQLVPAGHIDADVVKLECAEGRVLGCSFGAEAGDTAFLDAFVVNREVLRDLLAWYETNDHLDLFEAMESDYRRLNVRTFNYEGFVAPVFNMRALYQVSMDLRDPDIAAQLFKPERTIKTKSHDTSPAKYESGCVVENSLVSSSCKIAGEVRGSILGRHCVIEPGAVVTDSVLMQGTTVKSGAKVANAIIDRNNTIDTGMVLCGTPERILYYAKSDDYRAGTDN